MRRLRYSRWKIVIPGACIVGLLLASGSLWAKGVEPSAFSLQPSAGVSAHSTLNTQLSTFNLQSIPALKADLDLPTAKPGGLVVRNSGPRTGNRSSVSDAPVFARRGSPDPAVERTEGLPIRKLSQRPTIGPVCVPMNRDRTAEGIPTINTQHSTLNTQLSTNPFGSQKADNGYALFRDDRAVPRKETQPGVTWRAVFGMVTRLVAVAILAYCCLLGLKWLLTRRRGANAAGPDGSGLSLAGTVPLGSNRSVHVIRAGGKDYLVGATGSTINLLAELGESPEPEVVIESRSFESVLKSYAVPGAEAAAKALAGKLHDAAALLRHKAETLRRASTGGGMGA